MRTILCMAGTALVLAMSSAASARSLEATDGRSYALVVGSNPGGAGQETLRYAESDAVRMAALLRDLGGYQAGDVRLLLQPTRARLTRELLAMAARLAGDASRGTPSRFFFYYSGHARATALNLGAEEVPLDALREQLLGLPTQLTVVVLDACQSGAFSRVKGAQPAADFSFNSVARLGATGVAIMASSSGSELSQESEELGSSYFTHHLLVALRGAGDADGDGRVSLDEAYRYARQRTLVSTAATAVGSQHVTLETNLRGKGDVALSYPARATAHMELPASLAGDVLVRVMPAGAVVAELHKSRGGAVRLALPPGRYQVLVRTPPVLQRCDLTLRTGHVAKLAQSTCERAPLVQATAKAGQAPAGVAQRPRLAIELGAGASVPIHDAYIDRLGEFGFHDQQFLHGNLGVTGVYQLPGHFHVGLGLSQLDQGRYQRHNTEGAHHFTWSTTALRLHVRGVLPLAGGLLVPFVEAGGGVARASTRYEQEATLEASKEAFWGYHLGVAAGVQIMPWRRLGVYGRLGYDHAPVIENLLGDTHNSGGTSVLLGIRTEL